MAEPIQISLFQGIAEPGLDEAIQTLAVRRYPKGMVVFDQGERSEDVYHVVSGDVEIVSQNAEGDLVHVAYLKPGNIFGEFSFLTGTPRSTAAVAKEETTLVELSVGWLRDLSAKYPQVQDRLLELYRSRVLMNVLRASKLFSVLTPDELADVSANMVLKRCTKGFEIIKEGATDLSLAIIKRGKVQVTKRKGSEQVVLGALGPGDVLGEMAVITGEPRSASAHAEDDAEYMELPGDNFKAAIAKYPKLLKAIEDIVRSRAEQTRRALEQVIDEIVGPAWSDTEDMGIAVDSLKSTIQYRLVEAGGERKPGGDGKLSRVSVSRWTFETPAGAPALEKGRKIDLQLLKDKVKDLDPLLLKDPIPSEVSETEGQKVTARFEAADELRSRLSKIVTALAKARFRLFVYPEYDVSKKGVALEIHTKSGTKSFAPLVALSQTNGRASMADIWKAGEIAQVTIYHREKEILSTKALALEEAEGATQFQFEYETSQERTTLEEFLRAVSKELGYGQTAAAAKKPASGSPVLTKHFNKPAEFLRTYMTSMESGLLKINVKDAIPFGSQVNVHLSIGGDRGVRRMALTGLVREWKDGICEVEIDDPPVEVREKIEQLCKKLVEERSEETWKKRKDQLVQSGVAIPKEKPKETAKNLVLGAISAAVLSMSLIWAINTREETKKAEEAQLAETTAKKSELKDVIITFQAKEGEIQVRSLEITSLKPDLQDGSVLIKTPSKSFTIPSTETEKLPPFMKRQLEQLIALQKLP